MDQLQFQALALQISNWVVNAVPNLVAALVILGVGYFVASKLSRLIVMVMGSRPSVDQTLTPVVAAIIRYIVLIITFIAVLGQLGVQIASMLALLGAAGLAIGLALQGTLSNIAAGLMLLWLRPFRAGDYIDASGIAGTVVEVGLFASTLRTADGVYHFSPNSDLWNKPILNYSRNPTRRVQVQISIDYEDDIATARSVLLDLAASDSRVLDDPKPVVMVEALADSGVNLTLRCWSSTADFWPVSWDLRERAKTAIEGAGLSIPYPQQVIRHVGDPASAQAFSPPAPSRPTESGVPGV